MGKNDQILIAVRDGKLLEPAGENLKAWLDGGFLPVWALDSLEELIAAEAWEELNDRFYKNLEFGTGGMRGRTIGKIMTAAEKGELSSLGTPAHPSVGVSSLNDFNIIRATIGLFRYCENYLRAQLRTEQNPRLVIAHDVRHFSRHFCELAASTWTSLGAEAMVFDGPRSTPQLSFSVRYLNAAAGIVITASHNPPHDNGYKVYFEDGAQVVSPHDQGIITQVSKVAWAEVVPFLEKKLDAVVTLPTEVDKAYLEVLEENVLDRSLLSTTRPKVVFTPIHGTGSLMALPLLKRFGVEVETVEEQERMDPRFPTVKSPNPENAEALTLAIERADEIGADVVLATDPDSDRMGVAVRGESGAMELLTGNTIGSLLAEYRIGKFKELGVLPAAGTRRAAIIKTFVTTPLQAAIAETHGLKVIDTLTGFKWIGEKLLFYEKELAEKLLEAEGATLDYDTIDRRKRIELLLKYSTFFVFGGEESYGYLANDRVRDKDAHAAAIMFCELAAALKNAGKTFAEYLDELYLKYGYFSESLLNIFYEGATGAVKILNILESYRSNPPSEIGGFAVTRFDDFGAKDIKDADGKLIPRQDFYFLEFDNGYTYAVRGSGTEPKIKFYLFGHEDVTEPAALPVAKEKTRRTLEALKTAIEIDARRRAEE